FDHEQLPEVTGGSEEVGTLEPARTFCECCEGEPVPGRDDLVVERRLRTAVANLEQPRARLGVELTTQDRAAVLERLQQLGRRPLLRRPGVRQPFDAVGV